MLERERCQVKKGLPVYQDCLFTRGSAHAILWSMRGLRMALWPPHKGLSGLSRGRELNCYGELPQSNVKSPLPASSLCFKFNELGHHVLLSLKGRPRASSAKMTALGRLLYGRNFILTRTLDRSAKRGGWGYRYTSSWPAFAPQLLRLNVASLCFHHRGCHPGTEDLVVRGTDGLRQFVQRHLRRASNRGHDFLRVFGQIVNESAVAILPHGCLSGFRTVALLCSSSRFPVLIYKRFGLVGCIALNRVAFVLKFDRHSKNVRLHRA
jgi:hypothetical protein